MSDKTEEIEKNFLLTLEELQECIQIDPIEKWVKRNSKAVEHYKSTILQSYLRQITAKQCEKGANEGKDRKQLLRLTPEEIRLAHELDTERNILERIFASDRVLAICADCEKVFIDCKHREAYLSIVRLTDRTHAVDHENAMKFTEQELCNLEKIIN